MSYIKYTEPTFDHEGINAEMDNVAYELREDYSPEKYEAESLRIIEVGDRLLNERKKVHRKFWLIGEARRKNKERLNDLNKMLSSVNHHVGKIVAITYGKPKLARKGNKS